MRRLLGRLVGRFAPGRRLLGRVAPQRGAAARGRRGRTQTLLWLHDDNVLVADDLHEEDALLLVALEAVRLRVVVEFEAHDEAERAHEDLQPVGYDRHDDVDVLVLFLEGAADGGVVDEAEAQQLQIDDGRDERDGVQRGEAQDRVLGSVFEEEEGRCAAQNKLERKRRLVSPYQGLGRLTPGKPLNLNNIALTQSLKISYPIEIV